MYTKTHGEAGEICTQKVYGATTGRYSGTIPRVLKLRPWKRSMPGNNAVSRSEAIRRLVELGLKKGK
jgi:hypothetical protein